ncbi:MAG: MFS transporter [Paludibacter sp.]|nr:MFS transporter [Paludibacter sp.]MDD4198122.1 MFS transporter [Paludibacter sp.]MDD4427382.1 MFS transporter [Paludibacter sp.]
MNKLWTASFLSACVGNFLLFFAFYLLIPIFPLYLIDTFDASKSLVGLVLSSYTLAALFVRPVAGFLLDLFPRKPQYLIAFLLFVLTFIGYPLVTTVNLFLIIRILHGTSFGFVTTAGNSLVVDILPASRRGEGLGFFGVANNLAMVVGPMTSLLMHEKEMDYKLIFYLSIISGLLGFVFASMIKVHKPFESNKERIRGFDRFFLFKGFKAGVSLLLTGIPYGMFTTYLAIYGKELGIDVGLGLFFSLLAVGLVFSRLFSGKMVDRGKLNKAIEYGLFISVTGLFLLASLHRLNDYNHLLVNVLFLVIPVILGLGYGLIFPAFNTLFVNLAPNNRRATASSTFMTSWDLGVGTGLILGGQFADSNGGLPLAFLVGALLSLFSFVYFVKSAGPHFLRNKLR